MIASDAGRRSNMIEMYVLFAVFFHILLDFKVLVPSDTFLMAWQYQLHQ